MSYKNSLIHFLSLLRNASTARILVIEYSPSKQILPFLDILQDFGYIRGYRLIAVDCRLEILLKYRNREPAISRIIAFSRRKSNRRFPQQGIFILSTSQGLMSHFTAYKLGIGGEVLCHIS